MGRWHANAAQRAGGSVAGVADPDRDRAARLAGRYRAAVFTSVERLLMSGPLDVIHICSPVSSHYPIAESAIRAGCHLLVEKPMTARATETERLFQLAWDQGVKVCPVHQFAFQDGVLKAKQQLPAIGRLIDISAFIVSAGGTGLSEKRLDQIVADILPHPLSLIQIFLPEALAGASWTVIRPGWGEMRLMGEVSATTISVFISMTARPTLNVLELKGTEGTIHVNLFHGYSFLQSGRVSRFRKIVQPFEHSGKNLKSATMNLGRRLIRRETAYPGLQRLVRSFYASVKANSPPPISPSDAESIARVRDELLRLAGLALDEVPA